MHAKSMLMNTFNHNGRAIKYHDNLGEGTNSSNIMASLVQLFNVWEIQMLVLLSFMLQVFLFFASGLRRRTKNGFLMFLVWIAYLGADLVAAYTLGVISRQEYGGGCAGTHHQLAVLWAPFLLVHLGGQDPITGFSLEDNNLWQRHLLNLGVQVTLTLDIFYKSANGINTKLLAPSILLFITGTIKYGERTWALRSGVLRTLKYSPVPYRYGPRTFSQLGREFATKVREQLGRDKASVLCAALVCIYSALSFFWDDEFFRRDPYGFDFWRGQHGQPVHDEVLKILEIELSLVYNYIYTKAMVLQTQGGIILRCISQASFVASFLLFATTIAGSSKQQRECYSSIDTATTCALFVGGLSLEACALFTTVSSPWAWLWLQARRRCSFLASIIAGWQSKRVLWSHSMGQYNLRDYLAKYDQRKSRPWKRRVMARIRKVVDKTCGRELQFWVSKQLDIEFVEVDEGIMRCIFEKVAQLAEEKQLILTSPAQPLPPQHWPNLLGTKLRQFFVDDPERTTISWDCIVWLHGYTEAQLRVYRPCPGDVDGASTGVMVRKLSNYVAYLMATQPGMLPFDKRADTDGIADFFAAAAEKIGNDTDGDDDPFRRVATEQLHLDEVQLSNDCTKEHLLETREAWIRLLIYIADRSRPEMHAAQLAKGGELLTFVWLFMAHKGLGNASLYRVGLTRGPLPLFRLESQPEQQNDSGSSQAQVCLCVRV